MRARVGEKLGPYEILAPIGAGGMGEVWKARDTRLDRIVAIKQLKSGSESRFGQEARAIAALNHQHICQIYDVGDDYLVMEYIDGQQLRGPMPLEEASRIALQIASALEALHDRGMLHRDLKPGNVLVTKSGVKLLDFGLAKVTQAGSNDATATALTVEGTVMGTVAYMSPEQARGAPLDVRSEVFAFGAVLYEMLSGRRAFDGSSMAEIVTAVLRDTPLALDSPLASVVDRCLAKVPGERYSTMGEVREAIERASSADAVPAKPLNLHSSIAVLPFANISRNADDEFFSDGLAEEILNILAHIPGLKVAARTSSFAFRGREEDVRGIGNALSVRTVLEGSVRRAGNRIRVTAQLINAIDGYNLWSERFDREITDVFAVQDEIAAAIANQLEVKLASSSAVRQRPRNVAAYEAYLEGHHHWLKLNAAGLRKSLECYQRAVALDPNYAMAYGGIAGYYTGVAMWGIGNPAQALPLAREAADRALALDPSLEFGHLWKAHVELFLDYNWEASAESFRLSARTGEYRMGHAMWHLISQGRWAEAEAAYQRLMQAEPLAAHPYYGKAWVFDCQGRFDEEAAILERALEIHPANDPTLRQYAICRARQGRFEDAMKIMDRAIATHGRWSLNLVTAAMVHILAGRPDEARRLTSELLMQATGDTAPAAHIAGIYSLLGAMDEAFRWADRAVNEHHPHLLWIKQFFPFEAMRSDRRYPALLARINMS